MLEVASDTEIVADHREINSKWSNDREEYVDDDGHNVSLGQENLGELPLASNN